MTRPPVTVRLDPSQFDATPRELIASGDLRATTFRYASGIAGLRIDNAVGYVVVLPFVGQQVWRAEFYGRPLAMVSTFDEPVDTTGYLAGNGAYFIHCGGSAMGNPGPGDDHPLHGELPAARHTDVELVVDDDTMTVRGGFTHRVSFGPYLCAAMSLTVTAGSGLLDSTATITNLSGEARPLMYLAHINFRPAVGGHIVDALSPKRAAETRGDFPFDGSIDELLLAGVRVEPELVQSIPSAADADGWVTTLQRHTDGSTDVVSHNSPDLTHTIRWLRRSIDDDAFGFALPATAEADGFTAESAKGNVSLFGHGESLVARIRHGMRPPPVSEATTAQTTPQKWSTT